MKRIAFIIIALLVVNVTFGQKSARTSAFNALRKGKLDEAVKYIEPTITHEKTMNDAKTWFYRGNIWIEVATSQDPKYADLKPGALDKALESYKKTLELDESGRHKVDATKNLMFIAGQYYNEGVNNYNADNFEPAVVSFLKSADVNAMVGTIDTSAYQNAAVCAEKAGSYEKALEIYGKLIEMEFNDPSIYGSMASAYKGMGDTAKAFEIIASGREKYPSDFNILIAQTNLFLAIGDSEAALENLKLAAEQDPTNPTIFFAVGANYEQLGNTADAEVAYQTAIDLKPDYFDALFNLGAIYFNRAVSILTEANNLPLDATDKYDTMKAEANALFEKSMPYLEKAHEVDATDENTMLSLKEIYTRLQKLEKLKEINAKMAN